MSGEGRRGKGDGGRGERGLRLGFEPANNHRKIIIQGIIHHSTIIIGKSRKKTVHNYHENLVLVMIIEMMLYIAFDDCYPTSLKMSIKKTVTFL